MSFTKEQINFLREAIVPYMSEKRYAHTLGVEEMAERLGSICLADKVSELRCAALLHDVAKELSDEESLMLLAEYADISEEDLLSPPAFHAFCAPIVIRRDFPEYATDDIISSAFKHTTGGEDMTLFDLIIFLSDYIEEGRAYRECTALRERLFAELEKANGEESAAMIHRAALSELQATVAHLKEKGRYINPRTQRAMESLLKRGYTAL